MVGFEAEPFAVESDAVEWAIGALRRRGTISDVPEKVEGALRRIRKEVHLGAP